MNRYFSGNFNNFFKKVLVVLLIMFGLVTIFSSSLLAKPKSKAPNLFFDPPASDVPSKSFSREGIKKSRAALRTRNVDIKINLRKYKRILLNLFEDMNLEAEKTHVHMGSRGEMTWSGKLKDVEFGTVDITKYKGSWAGRVSWDGHLFLLRPRPKGGITIEEIDAGLLPPHRDPLVPDIDFEPLKENENNGENSPPIALDSGETIDLMVVYTQATQAIYGTSGIESMIINAVDSANTAYARSQITARLRLVHMAEIDYTETGDMGDALDEITDGNIAGVDALRDQYGADIVSMIDEDSNYCGIAWVMTPGWLSNSMERLAFNVTYSGCLGNHTMTHEIGHNEGCAHDRANSSVPGSYPYSHGHRDTVTGFRTIMSYSCPGGTCPRISNFSNPNVSFSGAPTGIDHNSDPDNSADNALSMNNTDQIVANWRQAVELSEPDPPSALAANAVSGEQIDLDWIDESDNEDGFLLERSEDNSNWIEIASLTPNSTSYEDLGLESGFTYYYRIRAFNGAGNSEFSNVVQETTLSSGIINQSFISSKDSYIVQTSPNQNFGNASFLMADGVALDANNGKYGEVMAVLSWDVSSLPNNAVVQSVGITVNMENTSSADYNLLEAKVPWSEGNVDWNDFSGSSSIGNSVLGVIPPLVLGEQTLNLNQAGINLVQGWISGSVSNHGLIVRTSGTNNGIIFSSKESSNPKPTIHISYTSGSAPQTVTVNFQNNGSYSGTQDAILRQRSPSSNYSNDTELVADGVEQDPSNGRYGEVMSVLSWDVSSIPNNAVVQSASITFNMVDPSSADYHFYEAKVPWAEGSVTWDDFSNTSSLGSAILGIIPPLIWNTQTFNLNSSGINLLQGWIDGSISNNGLVVRTSGTNNGIIFNSSEASFGQPILSITYDQP